ncbi:MAG: hypothetical protein FKY71_10130 [Spiribacter salinus]|uniref:Uncharacterized protein n=1 Tax=Spiribacter salinus TaxID=1335746 RepID=A0A540VQV8_9GAMM|nr:MAG: hypothetical protein FKY71_10130 [Spiribacter salinus]
MPSKHIFFVVRYSILLTGGGSWKAAKQDLSAYRRQLFAEERLDERIRLFEGLTLQSLKSQQFDADVSVSLVILTSAELPAHAADALDRSIQALPDWLDVKVVQADASGPGLRQLTQTAIDSLLSARMASSGVPYATVRLDDDDILSRTYVQALSRYVMHTFNDMAVSFPKGLIGTVSRENRRIDSVRRYYAPKHAQGIAHIASWSPADETPPRRNIFDCGRHTEIDTAVPTILDASFDSYIRTFHGSNDSGSVDKHAGWIEELPAAPPQALEQFPDEVFDAKAVTAAADARKDVRQRECQQIFAKLQACQRERGRLRRTLESRWHRKIGNKLRR